MNEKILKLVISVALSGVIGTYLIFTIKIIKEGKIKFSFSGLNSSKNSNRTTRNIKRFIERKFKDLKILARQERISIIIITLIMIGTSQNFFVMPKNLFIGIIAGLIVARIGRKIKRDIEKSKKTSDVAILFEAIEIYTKAGYSLIQAIKSAKLLTTTITPALDRTIALWSRGPQKALEYLKNELDIEESETLVLLMMYLEKTGSQKFQGVLQREARNIERLQRLKSEINIAQRPLILTIYRILPLAAIFGIVIGSLLYRVYYQFHSMGIIDKF